MQNSYEQWLKNQQPLQNQQQDPLNTSQNWLNSSLNLPPEQRFHALNDLVSKIVEDKPIEDPPVALIETHMPLIPRLPFQTFYSQFNFFPRYQNHFILYRPAPPVALMPQMPNLISTLSRPSFKQYRRSGSANELHFHLEESLYQLKSLEIERKVIESKLKMQKHDQNASFTKLPPNPSRVDRHIIDSLREYFKIQNLLIQFELKIESKKYEGFHVTFGKWLKSIKNVQEKRQIELINMNKRSQQRFIIDDYDVLQLASSINELQMSTAKMRTSLWCLNQIYIKFSNK